jgi:hypothetical protein
MTTAFETNPLAARWANPYSKRQVMVLRVRLVPWVGVLLFLTPAAAPAQPLPFDRLTTDLLDVTPPTARVAGAPGSMTLRPRACRSAPTSDVRRRIVDVATQEWGFFGFPIRDEAAVSAVEWARVIESDGDRAFFWRGFFPRLSDEEAMRVATSVAGYWAVTPEATMMVGRQNAALSAPDGPRRSDPWSAAFISWVMCEAGLGDASRFQRAIAHHAYIDQAIRARQGGAPQAAFVAHDAGETSIVPGDLLCSARRPVYRTLAERSRQLGVGARTHCDIVVKVDAPGARIYAVGGNVGRAVSIKLLRAARGATGHLQVTALDEGRPVFAHLTLRGAAIEPDAFDNTPTIKALACAGPAAASLRSSGVIAAPPASSAARRC